MTMPDPPGAASPGGLPVGADVNTVHLTIDEKGEYSKGWALAGCFALYGRVLALIPALILLWLFGIAAFFMAWFAQFTVYSSGKYPENTLAFLRRYMAWATRARAFMDALTDTYPMSIDDV